MPERGETFSPTQFGLALLSPAIFFGSKAPSLKDEEAQGKRVGRISFPASKRAPLAMRKHLT